MQELNNPSEYIDTYRTASHEPNQDTLHVLGVDSKTGEPVMFESFRETEEGMISVLRMRDPSSGEQILSEVKIPNRIEVIKTHSLELVARNKGKIAVIGTVVVTLAAGTGLIVKKLKSK